MPPIKRPEKILHFPGNFSEAEVQEWDISNKGNGQSFSSIPKDQLDTQKAGKIMAAQLLLTALFGNNPEKWDGSFLTDKMEALPEQKLKLNKNYNVEIKQSTPEGRLAAFFDANPHGELIIYIPSDIKPHRLSMDAKGNFVISKDPILKSGDPFEDRFYDQFIKANMNKVEQLIIDGNPDFEEQTLKAREHAEKRLEASEKEPMNVEAPAKIIPIDPAMRSKENYLARLNACIKEFNKTGKLLLDTGNWQALCIKKNLYRIREIIRDINDGSAMIEVGQSEVLKRNIQEAIAGLKQFAKVVDTKIANGEPPQLRQAMDKAYQLLSDPNGVIAETLNGLIIHDNMCKDYYLHASNLPESAELTSLIPSGTIPSDEFIKNMNLETADPKEVLGTLLWGGINNNIKHRLASCVDDFQFTDNEYSEAYDKLILQLNDAPYDIQMKYARALKALNFAITDKCYEIYQNAMDNAPGELDPEVYAAKALNESKEFLAYRGFKAFVTRDIAMGEFSCVYMAGFHHTDNPLEININNRTAAEIIGKLENGGIDEILDEKIVMGNLTKYESEAYPELLSKSGFGGGEIPRELQFKAAPAKPQEKVVPQKKAVTDTLFGTPSAQLDEKFFKFGVTSGGHVAHLIGIRSKNDGGVEINEELLSDTQPQRDHSQELTQAEVYSNLSDFANKKIFISMALDIAKEYEQPYADKSLKNILIEVKNYLTDATPHNQQQRIITIKDRLKSYTNAILQRQEKLQSKIQNNTATEKEKAEYAANEKRYVFANKYTNTFGVSMNGKLNIPQEERDRLKTKTYVEPSGVYTMYDKAGIWQRSYKSLFPHIPSPNDIKQGVGVMDCYFLSVLTQMAEKHPEEIMNNMIDNEDGTVSVRFYDKSNGNKPYYVTVNKTVNQSIAGQNYYAASSLWVQMYEKAYLQFRVETMGVKNSFESIHRSTSAAAMDILRPDTHMTVINRQVFSNKQLEKHLLRQPNSGMPDYYLPEEKQLFDFYANAVNKNKEILTAGVSPIGKLLDDDEYKALGIRPGHAYTVRKFIKRMDENGKLKLYVQIRDPYATFKTGYDKQGNLEAKSSKMSAVSAFLNAGSDNMGNFEVEFRDYQALFGSAPGMKLELVEQIAAMKFRDYKKNPLSPEELADEKNYVNLPDEQKISMAPDKMSLFAMDVSAVRNVDTFAYRDFQYNIIGSKLKTKEGFEEIMNQISETYKDLKSTDEWYVWTNTKQFNKMRDSLADLNKELQKVYKANNIEQRKFNVDDATLFALTEKLIKTSNEAYYYINDKSYNERRNNPDKKPNERSMHRMAAAANILSIASLDGRGQAWKGKDVEQLELITNDLAQRVELLSEGKNIPHDQISPEAIPDEKVRAKAQAKFNDTMMSGMQKVFGYLKSYMKSDKPKTPKMENDFIVIEDKEEALNDGFKATQKLEEKMNEAKQASMDDF